MSLSTKQLANLRHDLTSLADIKYDHLTDELLDHYATLTEGNMATGLTFYEASTAAFNAMGNGVGIQQIQDDYETATKQQVKARFWQIAKSHFHWPVVAITLLVGTLLYLIYTSLPSNYTKWLTYSLALSPIIVLLAAWIPYYRKKDSRQRLVWQYISSNGSWPLNLFNLWMGVYDNPDLLVPFTNHLRLSTVIAISCLFVSVCLAQLTRETFYYKPTLQR